MKKISQKGYKTEFYNILRSVFLEVLILEGCYFTDSNSSRYDIRKNKIYYFKAIHTSIMAAQKHTKKLSAEIFLHF